MLIAILDSGIDPGTLGLITTSQGTPKVLDLRDFSGEGHVPLAPVQLSWASHSPTDARHCWPGARKPQTDVQHCVAEPFDPPRSQDSAVSTTLLPQTGKGATDQPVCTRLSSRILPLHVNG